MKILLLNEIREELLGREVYSVEAGYYDGNQHFDHHKKYSNEVSPCVHPNVTVVPRDATIYVSHIDTDVILTLIKMMGKELPRGIELNAVQIIDSEGTAKIKDIKNRTLAYHLGVGYWARQNVPKVTSKVQNITGLIDELLSADVEDLIKNGEILAEQAQSAYKYDCLAHTSHAALFYKSKSSALDPRYAYEDGISWVIIYNEAWRTISIYCNPKSNCTSAGKTFAGIDFDGRPQASSSPRDILVTVQDAIKVYEEVSGISACNAF